MTDEEKLAEEWLDERYLKDMGVRKPCKEAYLAGFKAGYTQWHDLRKDPNDLPLVNSTVLDENGDKIEHIGYGKWQVYEVTE